MAGNQVFCKRLVVHGHAVELACEVSAVERLLPKWLGLFDALAWPEKVVPARGQVVPFAQEDVLRHVSPNAVACYYPEQLLDIYREGEQYWLVDDRWGICHLNLLKRTWTSWVIEHPRIDNVHLLEAAVMWPLAQMLRSKGLHLVPAAAVARDGFALLLISNVNLMRELQALARSGFKIVGQRWVALREEDGRIGMLQMPGVVENILGDDHETGLCRATSYTDLLDTFLGAGIHHAFCDAAILVNAGRRGEPSLTRLEGDDAIGAVRRRWPIVELHPVRAQGLSYRLAHVCPVHTLQLGRDPLATVDLLGKLRYQPHRAQD